MIQLKCITGPRVLKNRRYHCQVSVSSHHRHCNTRVRVSGNNGQVATEYRISTIQKVVIHHLQHNSVFCVCVFLKIIFVMFNGKHIYILYLRCNYLNILLLCRSAKKEIFHGMGLHCRPNRRICLSNV